MRLVARYFNRKAQKRRDAGDDDEAMRFYRMREFNIAEIYNRLLGIAIDIFGAE